MKKAILACKVLYSEILEITNGNDNVRVEFLPQGLHNLADSDKMRARIQVKIDELETEDSYDYIILGYGLCSKGVEGLKTKNAKLVIAMIHDCIPFLVNKNKYSDSLRSERTYFLSKGWIDCGGDVYKAFLSMTDQKDTLVSKFKKYNNENEKNNADWYEKENYINQKKYNEKTAKWITYECIKNYEMVVLIDNGNLSSIHFQYLKEKYEFLRTLFNENNGHELEYKIIQGDINLLKELIFFEEEKDNKNILIISPNTPLKLENKLLRI